MEDWKQAFWLTKFELKYYLKSFLLLAAILIMLLIFIVPTMAEYFENSFLSIDIFFIIAFCFVTHWIRPKPFKIEDHNSGFLLSPYLVLLQQLPTRKEIIVKHRFFTYLVISIPFNILFLVLLYILTPVIHDTMTIGSYTVFSVFWLCFSIYFGCLELITDTGINKVPAMVRNLLLGFLLIIVMICLFSHGFVHWTIEVSINHPVIVILVSLILAVLGFKFWMGRMVRKIEMTDYL